MVQVSRDERVGFRGNYDCGIAHGYDGQNQREEAQQWNFRRADDADGSERLVHRDRNIAERRIVHRTIKLVCPCGVREDALNTRTQFSGGLSLSHCSREPMTNFVAAVKRGGTVVQVGTLPHEPLPFVVNEIMSKELDLKGAFRWGIEFDWAVDYLSSRRVDVRPLLSGQFPLQDAVKAFELAKDKTRSTKVQVIAA